MLTRKTQAILVLLLTITAVSWAKDVRAPISTDTTWTEASEEQISGTITDDSGNPIADATVQAWQNGSVLKSTESSDDGSYSLSVSGACAIRAYSSGYYAKVYSSELTAPASGVDIALSSVPNILPSPVIPCDLWDQDGTIFDEPTEHIPELIQIGDVITAKDPDGVACGLAYVGDAGTDEGDYFIHVLGDDPNTTGVDEGAEDGDIISFFINGEEAFVTFGTPEWNSGGSHKVSLKSPKISNPSIVTDDVLNIQPNSATLRGNITDTGGKSCDERGFDWGTSSASYDQEWTEIGSFGTGNFSHTISGLNPNTTYYFRAKAHNSAGWGYGTEYQFTTMVATPTVTNSTGESNVTATSARLNGEVTDTGGENPTVHVYWGETDGGTTPGDWDNDENLGTLGLGTFYKDITGLTPNTTYYYRCYATNSAGDDWAESSESFTTPSIKLTAPNGGECIKGGSSLNVTWNTTGSSIDHIHLLYSTDSGSNYQDIVASTDNDGTHPWTTPEIDSAKVRVKAEAYDASNNALAEDESDNDFTIDSTPPETTKGETGTEGENDWYTSDVTVELSATDNLCDVKKTEYKINEGSWQTYSSEFNVSSEGTTTVYYRSEDNAGNVEEIKSQEIKIDKTPPPLPVISSSTHPENVWKSSNDPSFSWTQPSDTSGIAGYSYVFDHSPSTTPDTTSEGTGRSKSYSNQANGTWYFHVRAKDGTGNWGITDHYGPVKIATIDHYLVTPSAPQDLSADVASIEITAQAKDGNNNNMQIAGITITWTATNGGTFASDTTDTDETGLATNTFNTSTVANTTHVVTATDANGKSGDSATITVIAGELNQFAFDTISSPQTAGTAFSIMIRAKDAFDNTVTSFTNAVELTDSTGTITPQTSGNFTNGVWSGNVTVTKAQSDLYITATDDNATGTSNNFDVNPDAIVSYTVTSASYTQTAGVAFDVAVKAKDEYDNTVTTDSTTSVTMTSSSETMLFDGDGNGTFGETVDNVKKLSSGTFTISAKDTTAALGVTITATDGNQKTGISNAYTINPGELDHFTLTGYPTTITAGGAFTNDVVVTAYGAYDNVKTNYTGSVFFTSTDPQAELPYTENSPYTFTTGDNGEKTFSGSGFVLNTKGTQTITVTDGTISKKSSDITVTGIAKLFLSQYPTSMTAGEESSVFTVQLQDESSNPVNATEDIVVSLSSTSDGDKKEFRATSGGAALDPAQVTITSGKNSADFYYYDEKAGTWDIKVEDAAGNLISDTAQVTVNPNTASKLLLTSETATMTAGSESGAFTVERKDQYDNPTTTGQLVVNLDSDSTGKNKEFRANSGGSAVTFLTIPDGASQTTFYYYDEKAGTWTITADDNNGLSSDTVSITVNPAGISQIIFTTEPQTIVVGEVSGIMTIQTQDAYGNPVALDADTTVALTSTSDTGIFYSDAEGTTEITSVTIAAGASTADFYYKDTTSGIPILTASEDPDQAWTDAPQDVTVNPVVPKVTNSTGASDVTATSARLNGEVTSTGGENPTVHVYWGDNDGGTDTGSWEHDENLGTKGLGAFYKDIDSLTPNTKYYYRCYAENSAGGEWADNSESFTTQSIKLTAPNGGECIKGGSSYSVTWTTSGSGIDHISLLYSTDSGNTYPNTIIASTQDDGTYEWTVPEIDSSTVRVKAEAYDASNNSLAEDESDNDFTIDSTPPETTITLSGTEGDNGWYTSDVIVELNATDNLCGVKKTEYKINEGSWQTYSSEFTISSEGTTTVYYRSEDNAVGSPGNIESTKSQEIKIDKTPPSVTLTSPTGGENWTVGTTQDITWTAEDTTSSVASIKLKYSTDSGSTWTLIAEGEENDGKYLWTVPDKPSSNCRVEVTAYDNASNEAKDESGSDFTIGEQPKVIVKLPDTNLGPSPFTGKEITATIESDTDLSEVVSVNLSLSFAPAENIVVTGVTGVGEFSNWTITPNPQSDGSGVEIALYGPTTFPDVTSSPKDLIKITFDSHSNVSPPVNVTISKGTGNTIVGLNDGTTIDNVIIADQDANPNGTVISIPNELNIPTTISDACIGIGNDIEVVTPIPITIENPDGLEISSCNLTLTYDDSLIEVRPSSLGTLLEDAGWSSPTENTETAGQLAITLVGTNPITDGGEILNLNVVAKDTANRGDTANIGVQSAFFGLSDGSNGPPEETTGSQLTIGGLWGDVTGNGMAIALDASFVAQQSVGLKQLTNLKMKCGDVDLNGLLIALDASFIAQYSVGLKDSLPLSNALSSATGERLRDFYETPPTAPVLAVQKSASLEGIQYASADNPFTVKIDVDDANGILAGDISLTYNPEKVKFVSVTKTELTSEYNLVKNTKDNKVSVCMYGVKSLSGSGSLLKFEFVPVISDSSKDSAITFSKVNLYNEIGELNQNWTISTKIIPKSYSLLQNYPNPFNPETWIPFVLSESADVTIKIYDVAGNLIRSLYLGRKSAGLYIDRTRAAYWDGKNNHSEAVASGIYYYYLKANDYSAFKKMVILK